MGVLLALGGDPPANIPPAAIAPPPEPPRPKLVLRVRAGGGSVDARVRAYAAKVPHGKAGTGRDTRAFAFAARLYHDLRREGVHLDDATILDHLEEWDRGNDPPKGREVLAEILANAKDYGGKQ